MADRSLVMVIGPGRSGTSTMAGALAASGFHVPHPIKPNDRNPRGFFEPRWVVDFHKRILRAARVATLDSDPKAYDVVARRTAKPKVRDELREWLAARFESHDRLVIKDPRLVWFRDVWADAAEQVGVEPRFVIMLRHPSEVSASRAAYYSARDVSAVTGWINVALLSAELTASAPRCVVPYADLLADWRGPFTRLRDDLGLPLDPGPEARPHPVDDFIDPTLRRMTPGWSEVGAPYHLTDLAERVHGTLAAVAAEGASEERDAQLHALREEYDGFYQSARTMVRNEVRRRRARLVRRTRAETRREVTQRLTRAGDEQAAAQPTGPIVATRRTLAKVRRRIGGDR